MNKSKSISRFTVAAVRLFTVLLCLLSFQPDRAAAAGAVEMQVERIVVIAIKEYNDAMAAGDTGGWLKYFTDNVKRHGPQSSQEGKQAFSDYYRGEFESFQARWATKKMIVSGRTAAVEFEWDAVHKASGTPLKVDMVAVFGMASSGKFDSVNFYFDTAKLGQYAVVVTGSK